MHVRWVHAPMLCFALTAISGFAMRSSAYGALPVPYGNVLHAHSHLALLGWVYLALFLLLVPLLGGRAFAASRTVKRMFALTLVVVIGMFAAFLAQGYGPVSIAFSTLQLFLSYGFAWSLWRTMRSDRSHAARAARAGLVCLAVSSAGPWTLACLAATGLQASPLYDAAIYYYLHFQYNGWFTMGFAAALLRTIERRGIALDGKLIGLFVRGYGWTIAPAFLLSVPWLEPVAGLRLLAGAAAVLQLGAVIALLAALHRIRKPLEAIFAGMGGLMLRWALAILLVKTAMETGLVVPALSDWAFESRSVVIGYLHLTLLGFVSLTGLSLLAAQGWLSMERRAAKASGMMMLAGLIVNEAVLFLQGLYDGLGWGWVDRMDAMLWGASAAMAAGVTGIWTHGRTDGRWKKTSSESSSSAGASRV